MNGVLPLLHQRLRRDRVQLLLWIGGAAVLAVASYGGVLSSYGDEQERVGLLATVMANPVILLFRGLPSGAGDAQMVTFLLLPWLLILAALMSSFLVVRHTRGDEENGRLELLSATPAARWSPTLATLIHGAAANVLLGVLVAVSFLVNGAAGTGSVLVGLSCTLVGLVFLGIALVAAQLMPTSRGANSLSTWILIGTFVLAGAGNALGTPSDDLTRMRSSGLTWLSPFGWAENVRAYDADALGPLILLLLAAVALGAVGLALQSRRDIGGAFVRQRAGRVRASARFASNLALVSRESMPAVISWAVGGVLIGVLSTSLGAVTNQIGGDNPAVAEVLQKLGGGGDLERGMVVVFFSMLGIFAACAGVQTVVRARQDEAHGTAEVVLATAIGRGRWLADYLVVAAVAAGTTLVGGVLGGALGAATTSDAAALTRYAALAGLGQLLPAWLFVGVTALAFVLVPRLTIALGWTLVMLAAVVGLFGPLFGLSEQLTSLSPFAAALTPTTDGVDPGGTWWIAVAALGAGLGALALMRRRELTS